MSESQIVAMTMPKWGLSMTEGKVMEWLVEEGTDLSLGDDVLDIETEKIANTFEALDAGILRRKVADPEDVLPIGALLGVIAPLEITEDEVEAFIVTFLANYVPPEPEEEQEEGSGGYEELEANGYHLRYSKMGTGDKIILLVHGFGGDADRWLFTQQPLSSNATVYALDLPGHGQSTKSIQDGSVESLAKTVIAFMKALDIDSAQLVGHSLGGAIALKIALIEPALVSRLDLIASAGLGAEINNEYIQGFISTDSRKEMKKLLQKLVADPDLVNRSLVNDMLQFKRTDGVNAALKTISIGFIGDDGNQSDIMKEELHQLAMPIRVIWGTKDEIIPSAHAESLPPNVEVHLLDGYGHLVQLEAASEVNALLAS